MNEKRKSSWKPQAIAGALILVIIAVIIVKLIIWDKSGNVELEEVEEVTLTTKSWTSYLT